MVVTFFITLGSTSTIDALLLSKPVIFPNYEGLVWWDDMYLNASVVTSAPTPLALKKILENIEDVVRTYQGTRVATNCRRFLDEKDIVHRRTECDTNTSRPWVCNIILEIFARIYNAP